MFLWVFCRLGVKVPWVCGGCGLEPLPSSTTAFAPTRDDVWGGGWGNTDLNQH